MKTPDSPRAYPTPQGEPLPVEIREGKIVPRYVQAPALRDHGLGPRNLFWGSAMLFLALMMLVVAIFLAGPRAVLYVATGLLTFTALFVLTRLHIFRQRNGGFLALALVCLIGTTIPLVEKAYSLAKGFVEAHSMGLATAAPTVTFHAEDETVNAPLLTQSFALSKPQGDGKQVLVLHDSPVVIDGKQFLIKAGDRFPYVASKGDETTFAVRDLQVALPASSVEVVDPMALAKGVSGKPVAAKAPTKPAKSTSATDAELAEITRSAQQEAMRRYPALSVKGSLENEEYVSTYKQLQEAGSAEFFGNPEWPIALADMLAKRERWVIGGAPMTTNPDPILDAPATDPAAPAAEALLPNAPPEIAPRAEAVVPVARRAAPRPVNLPPVDSLDAGSDLPRAR